ncbi:MAG: PilZ domain-containing protein [Deltaproteobacteria bacterium]|nr:PilZ domain-containing protein [Deltaproteobacteria bacterium]
MIQEVLISPLGWAVIICPECGEKVHVKPGKELQHIVLERTCTCGAKHKLVFDTRSEHRKKCSFPGIFLADKNIPVTIKDISEIGASFEGNVRGLEIGSFYNLKIKISEDWVKVLTRVIRVNRKTVGISFVNIDADQKKIIEYYLLSS